jgi:hypothetical protein
MRLHARDGADGEHAKHPIVVPYIRSIVSLSSTN